MKETTCKYYLAGTDEEVLMGDVLSTTLVKELEDGRKIQRELEFVLNEDTLPFALEMELIDCSEDENEDLIDFDDQAFDDFRTAVGKDIDELMGKIEEQNKKIDQLNSRIEYLERIVPAKKSRKRNE